MPLPEAQRLNPSLAVLLSGSAIDDNRNNAIPANPLCFQSREELFDWPDKAVQKVTADMLAGMRSVAASVNELTEEQFCALRIQARAWFTIVRPDGVVTATNHPLTTWCGVYCVAAPEAVEGRSDSGVLRLYESRLGTMFTDATNCLMRQPYRSGHCAWRPVPGWLAVFPASNMYEIAPVRTSLGQLVLVTVRLRFVAPDQHGWPAW
jgi:hypothetical protein